MPPILFLIAFLFLSETLWAKSALYFSRKPASPHRSVPSNSGSSILELFYARILNSSSNTLRDPRVSGQVSQNNGFILASLWFSYFHCYSRNNSEEIKGWSGCGSRVQFTMMNGPYRRCLKQFLIWHQKLRSREQYMPMLNQAFPFYAVLYVHRMMPVSSTVILPTSINPIYTIPSRHMQSFVS